MHRFLAPFLWLDGRLQRGFDAVFHALMRRGVSKRAIRRNLWGLFIVCEAGDSLSIFWGKGDFWVQLPITLTMVGALVALWGHRMVLDDNADNAAEQSPLTRSRADDFAGGFKYIGYFHWVLMIFAPRTRTISTVLSCLAGFAAVALGYLGKTKPMAPKPKEPATAALAKPIAA